MLCNLLFMRAMLPFLKINIVQVIHQFLHILKRIWCAISRVFTSTIDCLLDLPLVLNMLTLCVYINAWRVVTSLSISSWILFSIYWRFSTTFPEFWAIWTHLIGMPSGYHKIQPSRHFILLQNHISLYMYIRLSWEGEGAWILNIIYIYHG